MESDLPLDPREWKEVSGYVAGLEGSEGRLQTRIHPADEMYCWELSAAHSSREAAAVLYFGTGQLVFRGVREVVGWRFGGLASVRSFLDFASGYGRATRFFARAMEPQRITVAEIDPGAVRFQEETFGVRGIVTGPDPSSLPIEGPFEAILASSFFSHLPAARFEAWLRCLVALVAPGGVLMFSVHGMDLLPEEAKDRSGGIVFVAASETTRLEGAEYGTAHVTPEFVRAVAKRVTAGGDRLLGFPSGLAGFQDLYILMRPPLPPVLDLRLPRYPRGALDDSGIRDGVVSVEGWAVGEFDERPPSVKLFLGDAVAAVLPGEGEYGALRRWSFEFPVAAVSPDDVVRIEAESARGLSKILVAATLRPYLPAPSV